MAKEGLVLTVGLRTVRGCGAGPVAPSGSWYVTACTLWLVLLLDISTSALVPLRVLNWGDTRVGC